MPETLLSQDIRQAMQDLSRTPYPAWCLASGLLLKGITAHKPMPAPAGSGSSFSFSQRLAVSKPTRISCLSFGLAHLLGGWIIYDGDVVNGAGFNFAWSTLYLIVNGKNSIGSIFKARVSPAALSLLAIGNATLYGKQFFWP